MVTVETMMNPGGYHTNVTVSRCILTSIGGVKSSFNWFLMVQVNIRLLDGVNNKFGLL